MLLKIYELITKLQTEIGNGAEVRLFVRDSALQIRVDWMDNDFHGRQQFTEIELMQMADESLAINYSVSRFKNEYARKIK